MSFLSEFAAGELAARGGPAMDFATRRTRGVVVTDR
jgi:hypothetical protein